MDISGSVTSTSGINNVISSFSAVPFSVQLSIMKFIPYVVSMTTRNLRCLRLTVRPLLYPLLSSLGAAKSTTGARQTFLWRRSSINRLLWHPLGPSRFEDDPVEGFTCDRQRDTPIRIFLP